MTVHVLGNATLDLSYRVVRHPDPGETCLCTARRSGPGGKGLNQAVAAGRAGAAVVFSTALGRDAAGHMLADTVETTPGVTLRAWWRDGTPSDESSIWVSGDGENAIVSTAACAQSITVAEAVAAISDARPGDVLVMQGNLSEATTAAALAAGRGQGVLTVLNPAPLRFALPPLMRHVDILVVNRVEAAALGLEPGEAGLVDYARRFGGALVVTLGAEGVLTAAAGELRRHPVPAVRAVDTTGAGDAFVGTLAAALAAGAALSEGVGLAVIAGGQAVLAEGALPDSADAGPPGPVA